MKILCRNVGLIATNCYLVVGEKGRGVVIDPGDDAAGIFEWIRAEGAEIEYIFLTHGHFDHVLAAPELKKLTGTRIVINKEDENGLSSSRYPFRARGKGALEKADVLVADGSVILCGGIEFKFMHTPGHTLGGMTIMAGDALFTGDTLFAGECGRCDLEGGDYGTMLRSLRKISELEGDFDVYPGHGPFSRLSYERANNKYMLLALNDENLS